MPQFMPFRGIRYTQQAGPLSDLLAPPYDVITPAQQRALEARNARNAVRLELAAGGEERYEAVAGLIRDWLRADALRREEDTTLYVYRQEFSEGGHPFQRSAVIAAVEAQPWDEGAVKPHEFTMSGPKEDRLKLLQAANVQLSPVFMIARDRAGTLRQFIENVSASREPDCTGTTIDGEQHHLWAVQAGSYEMRQLAPLLGESFYIADGHHRYETAVNYRNWRLEAETLPRDHPARFTMAAIVAADDPGLVIRPIHRLLPEAAPSDWRVRLEGTFEIEHVKMLSGETERSSELASVIEGADAVALGLEAQQVFRLKRRPGAALGGTLPPGMSEEWASIPPNVLRYGVLQPLWNITDDDLRAGRVEYSHDIEEVLQFMDTHQQATAFLLNPVTIQQTMSLADRAERMPQKSTFFHPKLGTGLVFYPLNP
jgi:uncharacterized protein (DUF1015 family)